jgi:hypothetical protein
MKKLLLILLLSTMVNANTGYYPITILTNMGYHSISYCSFNESCRYLNDKILNEVQQNNIKISNKKTNTLLYGGLSITGILITTTLISVLIIKTIYKKYIK